MKKSKSLLDISDSSDESSYKKYTAAIEKCVQSFDNINEWTDIVSFLNKLLKILSSYDFDTIPKSLIISKRLSQLLNPALPAGVHQKVIETYESILTKLDISKAPNEVPLFLYSLLPFFENASTIIKGQILELIEKHFVHICSKYTSMIPGVLLSVSCVLSEESNEHYAQVKGLFTKIQAEIGEKLFCDCLLIAISSSKLHRFPLLSFLQNEEYYKSGKSDFINERLLDALVNSLQDQSVLVLRVALDVLIECCPIGAVDVNTSADYKKLVSSVLLILLKKDISLNRRVFQWILGNSKIDNDAIEVANMQKIVFVLTEELESKSCDFQKWIKIMNLMLDRPQIAKPILAEIYAVLLKAISDSDKSNSGEYAQLINILSIFFQATSVSDVWEALSSVSVNQYSKAILFGIQNCSFLASEIPNEFLCILLINALQSLKRCPENFREITSLVSCLFQFFARQHATYRPFKLGSFEMCSYQDFVRYLAELVFEVFSECTPNHAPVVAEIALLISGIDKELAISCGFLKKLITNICSKHNDASTYNRILLQLAVVPPDLSTFVNDILDYLALNIRSEDFEIKATNLQIFALLASKCPSNLEKYLIKLLDSKCQECRIYMTVYEILANIYKSTKVDPFSFLRLKIALFSHPKFLDFYSKHLRIENELLAGFYDALLLTLYNYNNDSPSYFEIVVVMLRTMHTITKVCDKKVANAVLDSECRVLKIFNNLNTNMSSRRSFLGFLFFNICHRFCFNEAFFGPLFPSISAISHLCINDSKDTCAETLDLYIQLLAKVPSRFCTALIYSYLDSCIKREELGMNLYYSVLKLVDNIDEPSNPLFLCISIFTAYLFLAKIICDKDLIVFSERILNHCSTIDDSALYGQLLDLMLLLSTLPFSGMHASKFSNNGILKTFTQMKDLKHFVFEPAKKDHEFPDPQNLGRRFLSKLMSSVSNGQCAYSAQTLQVLAEYLPFCASIFSDIFIENGHTAYFISIIERVDLAHEFSLSLIKSVAKKRDNTEVILPEQYLSLVISLTNKLNDSEVESLMSLIQSKSKDILASCRKRQESALITSLLVSLNGRCAPKVPLNRATNDLVARFIENFIAFFRQADPNDFIELTYSNTITSASTFRDNNYIQVFIRQSSAISSALLSNDKNSGLIVSIYNIAVSLIKNRYSSIHFRGEKQHLCGVLLFNAYIGLFKTEIKSWTRDFIDFFLECNVMHLDASIRFLYREIIFLSLEKDPSKITDIFSKAHVFFLDRLSSTSSALFTSKESETSIRQQNIRKLSILLFIFPSSILQNFLPLFQALCADIIKSGQTSLLAELFILIKGLLIRFIDDALISIWPSILTEAISAFSRALTPDTVLDKSDLSLLTSICSFVEFFICVQRDDFLFYSPLLIDSVTNTSENIISQFVSTFSPFTQASSGAYSWPKIKASYGSIQDLANDMGLAVSSFSTKHKLSRQFAEGVLFEQCFDA